MTEGGVISPESETGPQIRILIVADDVKIRTMLETMAELKVQEMDTAGSMEEALTILNREPGKYNALITDKDLGKEDKGLELARRATEQFPGLVCGLIIRGATLLIDDEILKKSGIRFVFRKPFEVRTVTGIIERIGRVISQQSNQ